MALLGSYIDVRTIASMASNGTASFAHGLPTPGPDFVFVQATETGSATTQSGDWTVVFDATNVSITARHAITAVGRVTTVMAHSIIR